MESKDRSRLVNMGNHPFNVIANITGTVGSAKVYYYKPSFPCKLIDAKLKVKTAPGSSISVAITKSVVAALDVAKDKIVTGVTQTSDVTNSALAALATGTANSAAVIATLGANWREEMEADVEDTEAYKINIPSCTTTALDATIILEFMPV